MPSRKKRRADGSLRPCVARRRARLNRERQALIDSAPERQEWLQQFAPGARDRFFNNVRLRDVVWLKGFAEQTGLEREEASLALADLASVQHWLKLRTLDGTVVGIAPVRRGKWWRSTYDAEEMRA